MKTGGILILIILSSIPIHEVRARTRSRRDNDEEGEEIEEEKGKEGEQYCACAGPAPAGTASLRHSFTDMPLLFEHVMALLQRDPAVLEQSNLLEASTIRKRDTSQRRSRRSSRREARHAPTPENFERLLSQVETQLAEHDKNRSRNSKRKRESPTTMGTDKNTEVTKSHREKGEWKGNSGMKSKTKSNDRVSSKGREDEKDGPKSRIAKRSEDEDVGDSDQDPHSIYTHLVQDQARSGARESPSREYNSGQVQANSGSTNRKSEEEMHGPKSTIVKRSEDEEEEDVGDADADLVKDQAHGGAQEPPSREDNSGQARADSDDGGGGGGQQLVMGTFQAMIMPMSGPAQAISGLMPSG